MEKNIVYNIININEPIPNHVIVVGKGQRYECVPLERVIFRGVRFCDYIDGLEKSIRAEFDSKIQELENRIEKCEKRQDGNEVL